jgi:predicted ester cyclase
VSEENKAMVRRMVEAINAGEEDAAVQELFAPRAARRVMRLFAEFRMAFPDWREEIVELVAEDDTVAGRFKCSGTHRGEFLGEAPLASAWRWMRFSSCGRRAVGSWTSGRWRTAWAGCDSSGSSPHQSTGEAEARDDEGRSCTSKDARPTGGRMP